MQPPTFHIARYRATGRRFVIALLAASAASWGVLALPAAGDASGGANNVVVAGATASHTTSSKSGLQVASVGSPTVTSDNIARATSDSCTGCRAVSAALQTVFVTRNATDVSPGNFAVAANSNCTGCDSFAFAYQYVLMTQGSVYLSAAAQQRIAELRQLVSDTVSSGLPDSQLDSKLQALGAEFKAVIDQELEHAGIPAQGTVKVRVASDPVG